jgi:hypothetical protein
VVAYRLTALPARHVLIIVALPTRRSGDHLRAVITAFVCDPVLRDRRRGLRSARTHRVDGTSYACTRNRNRNRTGTGFGGASYAIRRRTALELGGFDEALDMGSVLPGGGEQDMLWRVLAAGHHVVYEPRVRAHTTIAANGPTRNTRSSSTTAP